MNLTNAPERGTVLGLITKEKIRQNSLHFKAICVPGTGILL